MYTSGQMINYEKYAKILKNTPEPILEDQIPKIKIDYKGLISYAHSRGVSVHDLSDDEKNKFISDTTIAEIRRGHTSEKRNEAI